MNIRIAFFCLLLSISLLSSRSYAAVQVGDLFYAFNADDLTARVTSCSEDALEVTVPSTVTYHDTTYNVKTIGTGAFWYKNVTSVVVEEGIDTIGVQAFCGCKNLTYLSLPNSLKRINQIAFGECRNLMNLRIPDGVVSIDTYATFTDVPNIEYYGSINLQNASKRGLNGYVDGLYVYQDETKTELLACGAALSGEISLPQSITRIGERAFDYCEEITSVIIPNGVTSVGSGVFQHCTKLQSVTLSNNLTNVSDNMFWDCEILESVSIPNSVQSIGYLAFDRCVKLSTIYIPASVTFIDMSPFRGCTVLNSIVIDVDNTKYDSRNNCNAVIETATNKLISGCNSTIIPNDVVSIGSYAFSESGIRQITLPDKISSLSSSVFLSCYNLTEVTLGKGITSIDWSAFDQCTNLQSVTCLATTPPEVDASMTDGICQDDMGEYGPCPISTPIYVPSQSLSAYKSAEKWKYFTNIQAIQTEAPMFPDDPGTLTYGLELKAAVVDGDELSGYAPTGAGGYPAGTEVTVTAQDIPGYKFVHWSDDVTDKTRTIVLNEATTLTALYSHSMIEIAIAANQWNFICLPPLGDKQYTEDMFTYDGLMDVQWGTYNGAKRAAGQSGWETPETFNALQGYILYSATAGTLRINAYEDEIRQGESGNISASLTAYDSNHPENASWNFLGNPYSQGFNIAGLAAAGIESPITVWNGVGYSTYTPDIDDYVLQPYEAFFIQKAEGGAERITFGSEYVEETDGSGRSVADDKGTLPGYFSVSSSSKVQFSKGNLQYRASTNTWRFGNNQYDYVGSDNANISSTYDGWIDLFCWGTGNNPTLISDDTNDYSTFVDWGVNAISNGGNEANLWRTPTKPEWMYLFQSRRNASSLYGKANVNGINGVIVLPDNWQAVEGIAFISGTGEYAQNTYTIEQWRKMESAGAVFLPAAGFRDPSNSLVRSVGVTGDYWSSTLMNENGACDLGFSAEFFNPQNFYSRNFVLSVRLVR